MRTVTSEKRGIDRATLAFLLTSLPCILWYLKLIDYPSLVAACHILQTAAPTSLCSTLPWQLITAMWKLHASSWGVVWWYGRGKIIPFLGRCLRTDRSHFNRARRWDCRKLVCLFAYHISFRNVTTQTFLHLKLIHVAFWLHTFCFLALCSLLRLVLWGKHGVSCFVGARGDV